MIWPRTGLRRSSFPFRTPSPTLPISQLEKPSYSSCMIRKRVTQFLRLAFLSLSIPIPFHQLTELGQVSESEGWVGSNWISLTKFKILRMGVRKSKTETWAMWLVREALDEYSSMNESFLPFLIDHDGKRKSKESEEMTS